MEMNELQRAIEAILFAAGEPVELARLCMALEADPEEVSAAANALADDWAFQRRGIRILKLEDAYQMVSSGECADYVTRALSCIHAEYDQDLTVEQLANRLGLDRSYFSDLFRDRTGVTPGQYLIRLRMNKAAELIARHGYTPTLAAQSCGYPDLAQFSKRFKAQFGISPRPYRQQAE